MEIELDDDIKDTLRNYEECKNKLSQILEKQHIQEKSLNCLKKERRMSIEETKFLRNEIKRKSNHVEEFHQILDYYNTVEDRCSNLTKENETLKEQVAALEKTQTENHAFWKGEIEKLEREREEKINFIKDEYEKQVASALAESDKSKKTSTRQIEFLKQEHRKEIEKCKQLISHTVTNYEEKLLKMNGDLASAQIEIRNLRQRCAASAQIYKGFSPIQKHEKESTSALAKKAVVISPLPGPSPVKITSVNPSARPSSTSPPSAPQVTIQAIPIPTDGTKNLPIKTNEAQISKVRFPAVKKRKLFSYSEHIIDLS